MCLRSESYQLHHPGCLILRTKACLWMIFLLQATANSQHSHKQQKRWVCVTSWSWSESGWREDWGGRTGGDWLGDGSSRDHGSDWHIFYRQTEDGMAQTHTQILLSTACMQEHLNTCVAGFYSEVNAAYKTWHVLYHRCVLIELMNALLSMEWSLKGNSDEFWKGAKKKKKAKCTSWIKKKTHVLHIYFVTLVAFTHCTNYQLHLHMKLPLNLQMFDAVRDDLVNVYNRNTCLKTEADDVTQPGKMTFIFQTIGINSWSQTLPVVQRQQGKSVTDAFSEEPCHAGKCLIQCWTMARILTHSPNQWQKHNGERRGKKRQVQMAVKWKLMADKN